MVQLLFDHNAQLDAVNDNYETALRAVVKASNTAVDLAFALLRLCANVRARDRDTAVSDSRWCQHQHFELRVAIAVRRSR